MLCYCRTHDTVPDWQVRRSGVGSLLHSHINSTNHNYLYLAHEKHTFILPLTHNRKMTTYMWNTTRIFNPRSICAHLYPYIIRDLFKKKEYLQPFFMTIKGTWRRAPNWSSRLRRKVRLAASLEAQLQMLDVPCILREVCPVHGNLTEKARNEINIRFLRFCISTCCK
jgi:hypothetical protein